MFLLTSISATAQTDRVDSLLNDLIFSDEKLLSEISLDKKDFIYGGLNYSNKTFITKLFLYLTNLFSFKELETKSLVFKCSLLTKTDILRESKFDYSCYLIYREGFYYLVFYKGFEVKIMEEDCDESK